MIKLLKLDRTNTIRVLPVLIYRYLFAHISSDEYHSWFHLNATMSTEEANIFLFTVGFKLSHCTVSTFESIDLKPCSQIWIVVSGEIKCNTIYNIIWTYHSIGSTWCVLLSEQYRVIKCFVLQIDKCRYFSTVNNVHTLYDWTVLQRTHSWSNICTC